MAETIQIEYQPLGPVATGDLVLLVADDLAPAPSAAEMVAPGADLPGLVARAAAAERWKAKPASILVVPAPAGLSADRLVLVGTGPKGGSPGNGAAERPPLDWIKLGGVVAGAIAGRGATLLADAAGAAPSSAEVADLTLGARLRAYRFDRYRTKKTGEKAGAEKGGEGEETPGTTKLTVMAPEPGAARRAAKVADGLAAGIVMARDLVNEPPNVLDPEEFARRTEPLEKLGVEVEVLDEKAMRKLGMRALLAVAQGSAKEARTVIMRWNGAADAAAAPVAFVGKGVCFDSGGISIKPGGGMEDMKGDMAGAACVVGLMHALASRKARVNAVGAIGIVENMPDGRAQRPGDIVTSLSGQTIEIINTDAEGRLVLADVLWHVQERFKPRFMVDLATLTGAILVALGQEHAGMFSTSDELSERLSAAGRATGEKVWRLPLTPEYDKMVDSKFADMKNTGGRHAGSITAAQFLRRFTNDVPWAHLDIAGTGFSSTQSEINRSWGSGWGVRLLDRLVRDHYEEG